MKWIQHIPRYALPGGFAALDFMQRVHQGESFPGALLGAGMTMAVWQFLPGPMTALMLGQLVAAAGPAAMSAYRTRRAYLQSLMRPQLGRGFADTQPAYTMRQAALQAINRSYLNARFYLGQEASFLHT